MRLGALSTALSFLVWQPDFQYSEDHNTSSRTKVSNIKLTALIMSERL